MLSVLAQTAALIAVGVVWRAVRPWGLDPDVTRRVLTGLVYVLLLPALVLDVLWRAPLGLDAGRTAASAAVGVFAGLAAAWAWTRVRRMPSAERGALLLAAAFGNVTYLGLPVLESAFGGWARTVAIEYDLFACTPLLLTVGIVIARAHGTGVDDEHLLAGLAKVPALWAALVAVGLNAFDVPTPATVGDALSRLGGGVMPLMLISIGLALQWERDWRGRVPAVLPVLAIRFAIAPLMVWGAAAASGLEGDVLGAVVLEAAMPSMVLGVVICDRYGLDTAWYAAAVTFSTAASVVALPLWHAIVA
ncbi:MAG TPA: AEC family transporter [Nitrospiria bacterium]|nr:AEC family transporter [Nitrospiria bacterium]